MLRLKSGKPSAAEGEFSPRQSHLRLGQAEAVGQLLPLGSHHVVVLLEGSLQAQQLRRGEGRPDALRLPGEGSVEQQAVLGHVVTYIGTGTGGPGQ